MRFDGKVCLVTGAGSPETASEGWFGRLVSGVL